MARRQQTHVQTEAARKDKSQTSEKSRPSLMTLLFQLLPFFVAVSIYFRCGITDDNPSSKFMVIRCAPAIALIIFVLSSLTNRNRPYAMKIATGLVFSDIGDAFLTWKGEQPYFLAGIVAFAVAQVIYGCSFGTQPINISFACVCSVIAAAVYFHLYQSLKGIMVYAILIYILLISYMVWRAIARVEFFSFSWSWPRLAAGMGALVFFFSDLIIALNKFSFYIANAQFITMSTYYTAQFLIAVSVLDGDL